MRSKGMMAIMWKMFGWLAKAIAAALIVSFLSIWTTGYVVNSYIETLLRQYNLPLETQPFALQGVWGSLWGADPRKTNAGGQAADSGQADPALPGIAGQDEALEGEAATGGPGTAAGADGDRGDGADSGAGESAGAPDGEAGGGGGDGGDGVGGAPEPGESGGEGAEADGTGGEAGSGGGAGEGAGSGQADDGGASADGAGAADGTGGADGAGDASAGGDAEAGLEDAPVIGSGEGEGPRAQGGAQSGETVVTTDRLLEARDRMAEEDRNKLFAILVSRLPAEEWQTISAYVEDGLTASELTNVQQIVAQYLSDAEYDELMGILRKY